MDFLNFSSVGFQNILHLVKLYFVFRKSSASEFSVQLIFGHLDFLWFARESNRRRHNLAICLVSEGAGVEGFYFPFGFLLWLRFRCRNDSPNAVCCSSVIRRFQQIQLEPFDQFSLNLTSYDSSVKCWKKVCEMKLLLLFSRQAAVVKIPVISVPWSARLTIQSQGVTLGHLHASQLPGQSQLQGLREFLDWELIIAG